MNIMKRSAVSGSAIAVVAKLDARVGYAALSVAMLLAVPMLLTGCADGMPPQNPYVCENGTAAEGSVPAANVNRCGSCDAGFLLDSAFACTDDLDGDTVLNNVDIDDDNDGLIEISSLLELHAVRYNLAGTSRKTGDDGAAVTIGAPTAPTDDCKTATIPAGATAGTGAGVYLCGYELVADLDFDADGDGRTWDAATYALDTDDANAVYFPIASANEGGWLPIGSEADRFVAVFEGNGKTIANLAMRRTNQLYGGLFGRTGAAARIRNINLAAALIAVSNETAFTFAGSLVGGSAGDIVAGSARGVAVVGFDSTSGRGAGRGGLVGSQLDGAIIVSHASGTVDGGAAGGDQVGGLVGRHNAGTIILSYASVTVDGGAGNGDQVGGLVGRQSADAIIASYATGDVDGGAGGIDQVGGLVGSQNAGMIVASYATGYVAGGTGDGDEVGGLVGNQVDSIIASYATGDVDGGNGNGDEVGGLVGNQVDSIAASYATGDVDGGAGNNDEVGGLVGNQADSIAASYATGDADGGSGTGDRVGKVTGAKDARAVPPPQSVYGFGATFGLEREGISPALPSGVTTPADLTARNAEGCGDPIYTTQDACELATKPAGLWTRIVGDFGTCAAPNTMAAEGVDYTAIATQTACEAATKAAGTWGPLWNAASVSTMDAWDFGSASQTPALRYADYDGPADTYDCDQFLDSIPGGSALVACGATLLPGQRQ